MAKTLVGVFDDAASAQRVGTELMALGLHSDNVRIMSNEQARGERGPEPEAERSFTQKVSDWFDSLFEDDTDRTQASHYTEAWRRGHYLVVADVENDKVDEAATIMNRYGTVDLSRRAEYWKSTGYAGAVEPSARPYTSDERQRELADYRAREQQQQATIPIVQEELSVGKRITQRGGVRIHSYIQERPVSELVRLREEKINVQRRPVHRAAMPGDAAFKEGTMEFTTRGEEAVVQKKPVVVEEVVVSKGIEEHEETVQERLRRKEVEVEQTGRSGQPTPRR